MGNKIKKIKFYCQPYLMKKEKKKGNNLKMNREVSFSLADPKSTETNIGPQDIEEHKDTLV